MKPFTLDDVVFSAQAGCVLEASVDKPGNVGPSNDFEDTSYGDFIISGISIGGAVKKAVEFGMQFKGGERGVGDLINLAVEDSMKRHSGKNTNLGMAMLIIPLSAACGVCIKDNSYTIKGLRNRVSRVIEGSTPQDTIELYRAIHLSDAEIGRSLKFDVKDPESKRRVREKGMNLHDIFRLSKWDSIARELVSGMEITFTVGYPALKDEFKRGRDIRGSILRCFFEILSKTPDTLIERKNNRDTAIEVSNKAKAVLEKGLRPTDIAYLDSVLRREGNRYNPGTTADLTAASIMMALLDKDVFVA